MLSKFALLMKPLADPLGLLLLGLAFAALHQAARRKWREAAAFGVFVGLMLLVAATSLVDRLMYSLERPYAHSSSGSLTNLDAVVMLGGIGSPSSFDAHGIDLGPAADRVMSAVEVTRENKVRNLVLGGGGNPDKPEPGAEGQVVAGWIKKWGVTEAKVIVLPGSRNTRDEAERVLALVQTNRWKRLALVTSAFHLPRAVAVFRTLDMEVVPVGCDFPAARERTSERPLIDWGRMDMLRIWLYEQQGWFFYRWHGWIKRGM
jgi:uncharacterized SAM-binding protein YcdF (DUF218 family)